MILVATSRSIQENEVCRKRRSIGIGQRDDWTTHLPSNGPALVRGRRRAVEPEKPTCGLRHEQHFVRASAFRETSRTSRMQPLIQNVTAWATGREAALSLPLLRLAPSNQCLGFLHIPNQLEVPTVKTKERLDCNTWRQCPERAVRGAKIQPSTGLHATRFHPPSATAEATP